MTFKNACEFIIRLSAEADRNANIATGKGHTNAQKGAQTVSLNEVISRCVPTPVLANIVHTRMVDQRLRITVSSASAATRVRFAGSKIQQEFETIGTVVDSVSVHVQPGDERKFLQTPSTNRPQKPSPSAIQTVDRLARTIEDPELGDALSRLARAMQKSLKFRME